IPQPVRADGGGAVEARGGADAVNAATQAGASGERRHDTRSGDFANGMVGRVRHIEVAGGIHGDARRGVEAGIGTRRVRGAGGASGAVETKRVTLCAVVVARLVADIVNEWGEPVVSTGAPVMVAVPLPLSIELATPGNGPRWLSVGVGEPVVWTRNVFVWPVVN